MKLFCLSFSTMGQRRYVAVGIDLEKYKKHPHLYKEKFRNALFRKMALYKKSLRRKAKS